MTAIVCVDNNNGIGKNDKLLISIPDDMRFFKETTSDSVVVMGRKTLFSFKDKAPLKNRINIVFTNSDKLKEEYKDYDNIFFVKSETELNEILENYKNKKVFIIGGASIYNKFIDSCDEVLVTKVNKTFDADSFFPDLTTHGFKIKSKSDIFNHDDITYQFLTYTK